MNDRFIKITITEALARVANGDRVEVIFQPDDGDTNHCYCVDRADLAKLPSAFEAGEKAQEMDFGVFFPFRHYRLGRGLLFVHTRPECRLTKDQLAESIRRGHGLDLFSNPGLSA